VLLVLCSVLSVLPAGEVAAQESNPKNILELSSSANRDDKQFYLSEQTIRARVPGQITFYHAYLEDSRLGERSYRESQAETFRQTYGGIKLALVTTAYTPELRFAVDYRDKIFPGVPIVFSEVGIQEMEGQKMWPGVTGLEVPVGIGPTLDLALRLQPDTKAVAVITNTSSSDNYWLVAAHNQILRHQDKVAEIDLIGPPSAQLLEKVAALPPHTVVLFQLGPEDASQPAFGIYDLLPAVAQRIPTYSPWSGLCMGYGCIGGAFDDLRAEDLMVGEIAARVLLGERPESIPVVQNGDLQVRVDWHALQRWNIPESALPPGSMIMNRPPSVWESYRKYFIAAIFVFLAQSLLIAGLLWQRARKRKAEATLRESEKRFRLMADTTPSLIWMCDDKGKASYLNQQRQLFTGSYLGVGHEDSWTKYVHPDDLKRVQDALLKGLNDHQAFSIEYRLRRIDGAYRRMFDVVAPRFNGDGSFAGFIGSAVDVTDQKLAREALETVSGQLIAAQEKERSRLARELHDDVCQRLATISFKIEKVNKSLGGEQALIGQQLEEIRQQCFILTGDVQALSHELHPSILYNLGLVTALRSFCREISEQNDVAVDLAASNVPESLPREVSLSLFRVVQEALHNAVKYSGQKHFDVQLNGKDGAIELEISDKGIGFDAATIENHEGLGLVSMSERIHQINGTFCIESEPTTGTRIRVCVPLRESKTSAISAN
jgi:PAS domain S-box-containing protein